MRIGERIKSKRIELGLSVDEVAEKLGKNRATIYRYEKDDIKDLPITVLEPLAKVLETTPADLMGWEEYEDPRIAERDAAIEDIERILTNNGWTLYCDSYDDDYFTIKNINGQTIIGLYDYELLSRYKSLKKKGKITADLLVSSESVFFKYLESLGYYISKDDPEHKPFIHYGNGAIAIDTQTLNNIRTRIDTYAKTTVDSTILKLNELELRNERHEKERLAQHLLKAAHERTDIEVTDEMRQHDDDIMDEDNF